MSRHPDAYETRDPLEYPDDYNHDEYESFPLYQNDEWLSECDDNWFEDSDMEAR